MMVEQTPEQIFAETNTRLAEKGEKLKPIMEWGLKLHDYSEAVLSLVYEYVFAKVFLNGKDANLNEMEQRVLEIFGDDCWKKANDPNAWKGFDLAGLIPMVGEKDKENGSQS